MLLGLFGAPFTPLDCRVLSREEHLTHVTRLLARFDYIDRVEASQTKPRLFVVASVSENPRAESAFALLQIQAAAVSVVSDFGVLDLLAG
ncbi:MAG TPA: hypothetical protein VKB78_06675 [Pirellulales bacterium]|nr:hypothetical protein [Pirellulales bacterium]